MPSTLTTDRSAPATRGDLDTLKTQLRREMRAEMEEALASWPVRDQRRSDIAQVVGDWDSRRQHREDIKDVLGGWDSRRQHREDIKDVLEGWDVRRQHREDMKEVLRDWGVSVFHFVVMSAFVIMLLVTLLRMASGNAAPDEPDSTPPSAEAAPAPVTDPASTGH